MSVESIICSVIFGIDNGLKPGRLADLKNGFDEQNSNAFCDREDKTYHALVSFTGKSIFKTPSKFTTLSCLLCS